MISMSSMRGRILGSALVVVMACGVISGRTRAADEAASPAPKIDRSAQAEADVRAYERAMGKDSSVSDEQKIKAMAVFRTAPVFRNRFLGISTLQNPTDAWVLMEILWETKPDLVVETGTYHGGSAALWAIILEHINPRAEVITIDIKDQRPRRAKNLPIVKERVTFLLGSSTAEDVVAEVHRRAKGKRVMVMLDSLHSKEHVAAELAAYAPLVPVGSYLVVQDTPLGPIEAVDEFLETNPNWIADRSRERYKDTNSVRGYLRRIR